MGISATFLLASHLLSRTNADLARIVIATVFASGFVGIFCVVRDDEGQTGLSRLRISILASEAWARLRGPARIAAYVLGAGLVISVLVFLVIPTKSHDNPQRLAVVASNPSHITSPAAPATTTPVPQLSQAVDVIVTSYANFAWPAPGSVARLFGTDDPDGIDISVGPGSADSVYASARGIVTSVTAADCCDNMFTVSIDHGSNLTTVYGLLANSTVEPGQRVEKGDVIGTMAASGTATSRQLHFEVHDQGQDVDPLRYLPASQFGLDSGSPQTTTCPSNAIIVDANSSLDLRFVADELNGFSLTSVNLTPVSEGAAKISGLPKAFLSMSLDTPPASTMAPSIAYELLATFSLGSERLEVDCRLVVQMPSEVPQFVAAPQATSSQAGLPPSAPVETPTDEPTTAATATVPSTTTATATATPTKPPATKTAIPTSTTKVEPSATPCSHNSKCSRP